MNSNSPLVRRAGAIAIVVGLVAVAPLSAQELSAGDRVRQFESRATLQAQVAAAEKQGRAQEAWLLKARLERGDFQEGDRIVVVVDGASAVRDTLPVRSGKVLQFQGLGEMSLAGVLRSELNDAVRTYLSKYLTSPVVRATPLLPLAVLGNVANPGFYYTPADVVLRDVIMRAGGPSGDADLGKIVIRRAGTVIWKAEDTRIALSDGLALDALHLRAGDEVFVPQRRHFNTQMLLGVISTSVALLAAVVSLSN